MRDFPSPRTQICVIGLFRFPVTIWDLVAIRSAPMALRHVWTLETLPAALGEKPGHGVLV